jgi:hypothetical protein
LPAASSSATLAVYSPGPANASTRTADPAPTPTTGTAHSEPRHTRTRARASGAACAPATTGRSTRARAALQPDPPSTRTAGSPGAALSTRTTNSRAAHAPAASATATRTRCAPSAKSRVSSETPSGNVPHGTARVKSHGRRSSRTTAPSTSVRTTAIPLASTASTPNVKRPRTHPGGTPRTALSTGAAASSSQTRTLRTATHACHPLPRRQRAATQRTTSASRREESPLRATCSHAPPVVVHVPPHHSQPSPD